jgi:ABC-type sulfate transport system substrate-binding protein
MRRAIITTLVAVAVLAAATSAQTTLLNVSYDPTRELHGGGGKLLSNSHRVN